MYAKERKKYKKTIRERALLLKDRRHGSGGRGMFLPRAYYERSEMNTFNIIRPPKTRGPLCSWVAATEGVSHMPYARAVGHFCSYIHEPALLHPMLDWSTVSTAYCLEGGCDHTSDNGILLCVVHAILPIYQKTQKHIAVVVHAVLSGCLDVVLADPHRRHNLVQVVTGQAFQ